MRYKNYEIRMADKNDIDKIIQFIQEEWPTEHILAKSRKIFEYEHLNEDGSVNFAIAEHIETKRIDAIHGFYNYDEKQSVRDYVGGLWQARRTEIPLLGVLVKRFLYEYTQCRSLVGIGSKPNTAVPIMKAFECKTGMLMHWYMLADKENKGSHKIDHLS